MSPRLTATEWAILLGIAAALAYACLPGWWTWPDAETIYTQHTQE